MITVFSCPKAFKGVTQTHQYNAVQSWKKLHPEVQVILVGDDEGVAEASRELGVSHIPECDRNEFGTPLISSIFGQARARAHHGFLCYANGDIILTSDFLACFLAVQKKRQRFLMVGKRWDLDCDTRLDFDAPSWERDLILYARDHGRKATQWQIDYFTFSATEFLDLPPFAVGRVRWDNWMIWNGTANGIPVIDASVFITAIHPNHDYSHHPQGQQGVWEGPEAIRNHELAGGWSHVYSISDATHKILGFADRPHPYKFLWIFPRITPPVCRWLRHIRTALPFRQFGNALRLMFQGQWRLVWSKLVGKLLGLLGRTGA